MTAHRPSDSATRRCSARESCIAARSTAGSRSSSFVWRMLSGTFAKRVHVRCAPTSSDDAVRPCFAMKSTSSGSMTSAISTAEELVIPSPRLHGNDRHFAIGCLQARIDCHQLLQRSALRALLKAPRTSVSVKLGIEHRCETLELVSLERAGHCHGVMHASVRLRMQKYGSIGR